MLSRAMPERVRGPAADAAASAASVLLIAGAYLMCAAFLVYLNSNAHATLSFDSASAGKAAIMLALSGAVGFAILTRYYRRQRRSRAVTEQLHAQLRSDGQTPERAAALVGCHQALTAARHDARQSAAMLRSIPADANIIEAALRWTPRPEWRPRREIPGMILSGLGLLLAFATMELTTAAIADAQGIGDHVWSGYSAGRIVWLTAVGLVGGGGLWWLTRRDLYLRKDALRRGLENCLNAGLDASATALLLLHMQHMIRNNKKAKHACAAATAPPPAAAAKTPAPP